MPAIQVRGVSKTYGGRRSRLRFWEPPAAAVVALENIDFTADYGEITGVIGSNSAGKTTLLRVVAGLEPIDCGQIVVADIDLGKDSEKAQRNIGSVLHDDFGFQPRRSVRENLERCAGACGRYVGRPDIEFLIEELGLRPHQGERVGGLSTGARRRLSLARALLGEPRILLLDEPTRSVDSEAAERINDLVLQAAHSRGACVMLVSHNPDDIRDLCDRTLVLDQGRLLRVNTARRAWGGALV